MTIRASVVDLRGDDPEAADVFWVDTNIWLLVSYSRFPPREGPSATSRAQVRAKPYLVYLKELRAARSRLVVGADVLGELAKHVEYVEHKIYESSNGPADLKVFRSMPAERADVVQEIEAVWTNVLSYATLSTNAILSSCVATALANLQLGDLVDGHDSVQIAEARRNGVTDIITDDRDYGTVAGLRVFTANQRLIAEANAAATLIRSRR